MKKKLFLVLLVFLGAAACKTNPFTGKSTLNFYQNTSIFPTAFAQYDQFLKDNKVVTGTDEARMITSVGQRIAKASERWLSANGYPGYLQDYQWEYNLVSDETVNAWCMPGGKIVFYTGIMPICQGETGDNPRGQQQQEPGGPAGQKLIDHHHRRRPHPAQGDR